VNDPHVEALHYTLVPTEQVTFAESVQPVEREQPGFALQLADGELIVTMHDHYANEADARRAVERYLHVWSVYAALVANPVEFEFEFVRSHVVDRDPPPPGAVQFLDMPVIASVTTVWSPTLQIPLRAYPDPPDAFTLDPDTETLWTRWQAYVEGREPLGSMAYFCLTVLDLGGRSTASTSSSLLTSRAYACARPRLVVRGA
jgi:hypothetical protein